MKNKLLKIISLLTLIAVLAVSMASCGSSASVANDASGTWNGIAWEYVKDGQTLTLKGEGAMTNAESADTVGWAAIRTSVKKIIMSDNITTLGDYAFYGMSKLESVDLSDNLTSIGKCAFAFCRTLGSIALPAGITSVGESAFEGCSSLKNVKLPSAITAMGDRAFAFCRSLETILIPCQIAALGAWTFKDCTSLNSVTVLNGYCAPSDTAFEGAKISAEKMNTIDNPDATTTVTVYYKDEAGNILKDAKSTVKNIGETYSEVAPTIEGYVVKGDKSFTGTADGRSVLELTFIYAKEEAVTEAPDVTEAPQKPVDEGISTSTVIALCIFGVVIVGICVGAFLLIRSDKKQKATGNTVRKNDSDKNKRK